MAKVAPDTLPAQQTPRFSGLNNPAAPGRENGSHVKDEEAGTRTSIVHAAVHEWRYFMHWSGWYDSGIAVTLRRFLRGRFFGLAAMVALFVALFFADIFMLAQVPGNTVSDLVLTLVFALFLLEFVGLALTDASYLFSFFFWMDLLGTVSMIFDISYMLGTSATESEKYTGQRGDENLIVVRAARATKLGARAGRLSRVMKLLRFLPFINNGEQDDGVKMARVISNQLTNVLSTRVAFLTICIVVVLPIFGMFTYPEVDDSMSAWTQLLSQNVDELYEAKAAVPKNTTAVTDLTIRLNIELARFGKFYKSVSYGPFTVCPGQKHGDNFDCASPGEPNYLEGIVFPTSFKEPSRKGSIRDISENRFMTSFDLSTPKQLESLANMTMIIFIILVMTVFGLVTSSSISVIALQPLERMLSVVRERCKQIFKYTDELKDEDEEEDEEEVEEYDDTEQSSEFVLLEKVVAKLAAIAHLSTTKDEPELKEGMTENEVMMLNWMQGAQVPAARGKSGTGRASTGSHEGVEGDENAEAAREGCIASSLNSLPANVVESLETDAFDTMSFAKDMKPLVAAYVVQTHQGSSAWVRSNVHDAQLAKFVTNCESRYIANPFHNFDHALDVECAAAHSMRLIEADRFLPEAAPFWLMVACVAHDLGHLGVNNPYLIETSHELALKYNDRSPLENMHCATMFQVVSDPEANVFSQVDKDCYKEIRKGVIDAILHTDVTKHNEMMKELSMLYQMNSEAFDDPESTSVVEVMQGNIQLAINMLLHGSDVGNPMKPWELARKLAHLCVDEFFAQGDLEKEKGIPVQMLNDRDKVNRPNSQIGFIEFVIAPMVEAIVHLFPQLDGMAGHLGTNIQNWFDVYVSEVNPPAETKEKMQARVTKVADKCAAVMRIDDHGRASIQIHG